MNVINRNEPLQEKRYISVYLVLASDGKTPATGLTFTGSEITVEKNESDGVAFSGTMVENTTPGRYRYEPTVGEADSIGPLTIQINKTGVQVANFSVLVIDGSNIFVPLKMPGGFVERSGLISGNITRAGYPDYAVLFSTSTTPLKVDFDPQLLVGALIKLSVLPDADAQTSFIILGAYFFDDSDDKTRSVVGIALEERFAIKEEGEIFLDTSWAGANKDEPANGSGWTFILASTQGGDSTFPGSGEAMSIFAFPATQNEVSKEHGTELFIDGVGGVNSTVWPAGTKGYPVKTKANLKKLSDDTGIDRYVVVGDVPSTDTNDMGDGKTVRAIGDVFFYSDSVGVGPIDCVFEDMEVRDDSALVKSRNSFRGCLLPGIVADLGSFCRLTDCSINDTVSPGDASQFINCKFSTINGLNGSISGNKLVGGNFTIFGGSGFLSIGGIVSATQDIYSFGGDLTINASCTGGIINIYDARGKITDNSGAGCTVNIFNAAFLTRADYIDFLNKTVLTRTPANNPLQYSIGSGTNQEIVNVTHETLSGVEKAKTEAKV